MKRVDPLMIVVGAIVLVILVGAGGIFWHLRHTSAPTANPAEAAQNSNVAPSGPVMPSSEAELCNLLQNGQSKLQQAQQQMDAESNPIRKGELQQQVGQAQQEVNSSISNFFAANPDFVDFIGTVAALQTNSYTKGDDLLLKVALPCNAFVDFSFWSNVNTAWGTVDTTKEMFLDPWRDTVANLHVGNSLTFSGHWTPFANDYDTQLRNNGNVVTGGTLTKLQKT